MASYVLDILMLYLIGNGENGVIFSAETITEVIDVGFAEKRRVEDTIYKILWCCSFLKRPD